MDAKQKQNSRPKLDRRNALKNVDYDASSTATTNSSSLHPSSSFNIAADDDDNDDLSSIGHKRSQSLDLNQKSFRIEGIDGEFDRICRSLGLSGIYDFSSLICRSFLLPCDQESQVVHQFIESLSNWMPEDGSTNWDSEPIFDVTPHESDDADDESDDDADLPLELPPRYDDYIDDAVDVMQEAHVVPDDVADAPQEAHVVEDHVANLPQEAHVVEDHVANLQQLCPICDNAIGVAFCCGHMFCVECGDTYDTCPVCRDRIHIRFRVFLPQ